MGFRRKQRSKQHLAAHEGAAEPLEGAVRPPEHPLIPAGPPEYITESGALSAFVEHVREAGVLAFDTEFIGESTYQPKPCLVQLATPARIALVDPLLLADLAGIWALVGDPSIATIVHAGASDLSTVRRNLGREPANVVDVQVAAGFVGMAYPCSLAKLVERFTGHPLAKGHTFTDWDARPLSASQLRYAADDVRYLPLIWETLRGELLRRNRLSWVEAETAARLEDPHRFDAAAHARRAARGYALDAAQDALLVALCIARDAIARHENLPHRSTIPDGSLLEIVREIPRTRQDLAAVRGLPRPVVARHGDALLETLARNPCAPTARFAVRRRRTEGARILAAVDAMLAEATRACAELEIAPVLATSRSDLLRHACETREAVAAGLQPPPLFAPGDWRAEAFGERIERAAE